VTPLDYEEPVSEAMAAGAINELEARALREAMELAAQVIAVDSFEVIKPAPARGLRPEEAKTG
jgi:Spy/CpxP family protein refolding chaperone